MKSNTYHNQCHISCIYKTLCHLKKKNQYFFFICLCGFCRLYSSSSLRKKHCIWHFAVGSGETHPQVCEGFASWPAKLFFPPLDCVTQARDPAAWRGILQRGNPQPHSRRVKVEDNVWHLKFDWFREKQEKPSVCWVVSSSESRRPQWGVLLLY